MTTTKLNKKFTFTFETEKEADSVCKALRGIYPDIKRDGKTIGTSSKGATQEGLNEWVAEAR